MLAINTNMGANQKYEFIFANKVKYEFTFADKIK